MVLWQHMQGVVGSLIANLLENLSVKKNKNRLRFDGVTALSLVPSFLLGHGVYATYTCLRRKPVANAGVPCVG